MYPINLKCPMHIEITSVCGQDGQIEAFKLMTVKLEQKPRKLVGKNRENFKRAQSACTSVPDFAVSKSIELQPRPGRFQDAIVEGDFERLLQVMVKAGAVQALMSILRLRNLW